MSTNSGDTMDTSDDSGITFQVTPGLPQTHDLSLPSSTLFIRDCYPEFYEMLTDLLKTDAYYFTLTGTPGIGKSVFYMYFFERYKQEFSQEKIVLASFDDDQNLKECKLWNPDPMSLEPSKEIPADVTLHLYDGVPNTLPSKQSKMICFASPNQTYLQRMGKFTRFHRSRYMPNWTLLEQLLARDALSINLRDEMIKTRWNFFGGTVRYTFLVDNEAINYGVGLVVEALESLTNVDQIIDAFQGRGDQQKNAHRILHYEKQTEYGVKPKLSPASKYISWRMDEQLKGKLSNDRAKLMNWLEGSGKASPLYGWLFESLAHEEFLEGIALEGKNLRNAQIAHFAISKTIGEYKRFNKESTDHIFEYKYRVPDVSNLRSIDSYWKTATELWLFQITRAVDHDVDVEGIIDILKRLDLLDRYVEGSFVVKLIFVVPNALKETFPLQKFKVDRIFGEGVSEADIAAMPCDKITGIKDGLSTYLATKGIKTISDLRQAKEQNPSAVSRVHSVLAAFEENLGLMQHQEAIKAIDQYVVGLDVPFALDEDDDLLNRIQT